MFKIKLLEKSLYYSDFELHLKIYTLNEEGPDNYRFKKSHVTRPPPGGNNVISIVKYACKSVIIGAKKGVNEP